MQTIKLPKTDKKLAEFKTKFADLFDSKTGEMLPYEEIKDELDEETVKALQDGGYLITEELTPKDEPKDDTKTEKPQIEKVGDDVRNVMKFEKGGFVFAKIPNTNKIAVRVVSLLTKDEAIEKFNEAGLEGKEPTTPQIQIVFSAEGVFGGFKGIMGSLNVQNRKGNETLFIINQNITQSEYNQLSQNQIPDCQYKIDEYRILKDGEKFETLKFQTDLNGGTIETAYKCFVVQSNNDKDIVVLKENEDGNGFNLGAKPFDNVAKFN